MAHPDRVLGVAFIAGGLGDITEAPRVNGKDIIYTPGLHSRWVRLGNGAKAHYVTSGETGPAVILLHGGIEGSSGTAGWRFMAPFLGANGFRVYCPDQPGFGWSDTSPEYIRKNAKDHVDFIKMFADALCLDKFYLSGNSMGCSNSCNFVMAHPDRVLGVAFIAGGLGDITEAPRVNGKDSKFSANPDYVSPGFDGTDEGMRVLMEGIIYAKSAIWPELVTMRVNAAARQRAGRVAAGLTPVAAPGSQNADENINANLSTKGRLNRLQIPMIYMYGLADVLIPAENGFNQEDSVPNVQFFYPDECGHQGQTDQPDMFNQVFLEFFRDGKVSWKTAQWAGVSRRRAIDPNRVEEPAGGFPKPIPEAYTDTETLRKALAATPVAAS
jgi:pimeloyl-ACP methyl ester carboxylesterase